MIKAKIYERSGRINGYEISGHAESGEYGHDVVCAAVSVLGITTANNLHEFANVKPEAKMEEGYLKVEIPLTLTEKRETTAQLILKMFQKNMEAVGKEYSEFIEVEVK
ncbi:MAG: ribosomal-processing cysteine protease Prp [Streptococcaceae bacterium]|jgi:uncharacterized protein YsxB (DUF464 family)|nr:ribosomal-processing cysteine protease Prp [Streptococcaceae bacterium]